MSKKLLLWVMLMALVTVVSAMVAAPPSVEATPVLECPNGYCDGGELLEPGGTGCRFVMGMTCHGGDILDPYVCDAHIC